MRPRCLPALVACVVAACGGAGPRPAPQPLPAAIAPALPPPMPADPHARGAAYLTAVAQDIQPNWGQFLEDCRLRLAPRHPLNDPALVAVAELTVEPGGALSVVRLETSGNADFDHAVRDVLAEARSVELPPTELLSDDERVHLRWVFARDLRQAGAASAAVVSIELPVLIVTDQLLARGELARAARRVARAPVSDPDRSVAAERVMVAALREALASTEASARTSAVEAIGRVRASALAPHVRALLASTMEPELRVVAVSTAAALADAEAVPVLVAALPADLDRDPVLAVAETAALVTLGRRADAAAAIARALEVRPVVGALHAHALAPDPAVTRRLPRWFARGDARTRAAVCAAVPAAGGGDAVVDRGLLDPDATVRAACTEAAARQGRSRLSAATLRRLRQLASDRDRLVRARAIAALGVVEAARVPRAVTDPAAEVRVAAAAHATEAELRGLAADPDPDVRAAALVTLGERAGELAARATSDSAPQVRRAATALLPDGDHLTRLLADGAPDVATAARIRLVAHRGRVAMAGPLLTDLAAAPPGSAERVRIALAWLSAPR